jgi:hypothetical protein
MFRGVALSQESTKKCFARAPARFVLPGPAFSGPERAPPAFARAPLQGAPAGLPLVLGRARACFPLPLVHSAALTLPLIRGLVFECVAGRHPDVQGVWGHEGTQGILTFDSIDSCMQVSFAF